MVVALIETSDVLEGRHPHQGVSVLVHRRRSPQTTSPQGYSSLIGGSRSSRTRRNTFPTVLADIVRPDVSPRTRSDPWPSDGRCLRRAVSSRDAPSPRKLGRETWRPARRLNSKSCRPRAMTVKMAAWAMRRSSRALWRTSWRDPSGRQGSDGLDGRPTRRRSVKPSSPPTVDVVPCQGCRSRCSSTRTSSRTWTRSSVNQSCRTASRSRNPPCRLRRAPHRHRSGLPAACLGKVAWSQ